MAKVRQPQRIPPPLMYGAGAIDAEIVLRENDGALAIAFWKTVRTVHLWAELPSSERAHAFQDSAVAARTELLERLSESELVESLQKTAALLEPRARAATVAKACSDIADWCVSRGRIHTAIEFTQAAAVALPDDAEFACTVARLCRTAGAYHRAETWYREAISRARKAQEWNQFARAYVGLGTVYGLRGNYSQANRALLRGLRAARRFSFRPIVATAAHELVVVAIHAGRAQEVVRHGRTALDAYGSDAGALALGHDIGLFLLEQGYYQEARLVLRALPADHGEPGTRLTRFSALVHLAGIDGDREGYEAALSRTAAPRDAVDDQVRLRACLAIARGALAMGDTDRAVEALERAKQLIEKSDDADARTAVERMEEALRDESGAAPPEARAAPAPLAGFARRLEKRIVKIAARSDAD